MKKLLDEKGYYYSPYVVLKTLTMSEMRVEPTFDQVVKIASRLASQPKMEKFYDIVINMQDKFAGNTNLALMFYHLNRFFQYGSVTYKIRKEKVEFLENIELNIPGKLLVLPHDEFMISIPSGSIRTSQGNMLNIYVAQEKVDESVYQNGKYEVEQNILDLIKANPGKIKRMIRCYAISYQDGAEDRTTSYYQFPVIEDEDVWEQFKELVRTTKAYEHKDTTLKVFNLMLNFCAYLSCPNPDIERILGIIKKPIKHGSKKWKKAERDNLINGYHYFDVGRIYSTRYDSEWEFDPDGIKEPMGKRYVYRFKVRRHIRAQWYGPRQEDKPGTEQKLIMIEDHWKGDDVKTAFKPKIVEVS